MNDRIQKMRDFFVLEKGQRAFWQPAEDPYVLADSYEKDGLSDIDRSTERLLYVLNKEKPVLFGDERIAFTRTVQTIPEIFTEKEMDGLSGIIDCHGSRSYLLGNRHVYMHGL